MKRSLFLLFAAILGLNVSYSQKLNTNQQKLKSGIFNFLKKETLTTNLSDYSATDIKFSYNETTYFVSVSESDIYPMYVTLFAGFNLPADYDKDVVAKVGQILNLYKGVKFYSGEDFIRFQAEMYLCDSKPFTDAFRSLIGAMGTMRTAFDEEYNKAKSKPKAVGDFTSRFKQNNGVHIWPSISNANDSKLYVSKVTITKENTIIDFVSYNGGQYQNCSIDRNSYIIANSQKYTLTKAEGISYAPKYTDYPDYESGFNVPLSFRLYFPPIPQSVKSIDFAETTKGGWKLTDINLDESNVIAANSDWISTSDHKWALVSVRCDTDKTIVKKKVIPQVEESAVFSSQEEYIEDADTGRKYYLRHSDIGFESDRYIVRGKTERYFNEEYPALPENVKRINISSGTQYYIKNLQIR